MDDNNPVVTFPCFFPKSSYILDFSKTGKSEKSKTQNGPMTAPMYSPALVGVLTCESLTSMSCSVACKNVGMDACAIGRVECVV